jgi:hypothetical protein
LEEALVFESIETPAELQEEETSNGDQKEIKEH